MHPLICVAMVPSLSLLFAWVVLVQAGSDNNGTDGEGAIGALTVHTQLGQTTFCGCEDDYPDACTDLPVQCADYQRFRADDFNLYDESNYGCGLGCDLNRKNWTWSCQDCPPGYKSLISKPCDEQVIVECVGCLNEKLSLVGNRQTGFACKNTTCKPTRRRPIPRDETVASTASGFNPTAAGVPDSYETCVRRPQDTLQTPIGLLDLLSGRPIKFKQSGIAVFENASQNTQTTLLLRSSGGENSWAYDLVTSLPIAGLNVAVFKNGTVGLVSQSSHGQAYISDGHGGQYVTTVFALTCGGELLAGFNNGPQLFFHNQSGSLKVFQTSKSLNKRNRKDIAIRLFSTVFRALSRRNHRRCPSQDQSSDAKANARDVCSNGCGSDHFQVPDLSFLRCCNAHDLCYDECSENFDTCNDNFRQCNVATCEGKYTSASQHEARARCILQAQLYADAVASPLGELVFDSDNRCECKTDFKV